MNQRTIGRAFKLAGLGLHSGLATEIAVRPASPDSGVVFIKDGQRIPALVSSVTATKRGTSLNGVAVTEHFLAAAYGLEIDNLEVYINGNELPALDGSALPYAEALLSAGPVDQGVPKKYLTVKSAVKVASSSAALSVAPFHGFKIFFMVDFPGVGRQEFSYSGNFLNEIAPARTFGYAEESAALKKAGLALGASTENALVLNEKGYVNQPRFPDELVRHKILDLIGDLALAGRPLQGEIRAEKSGHQLNIELVRRLLENDRAGH